MMPNQRALLARRLGGADLKIAVQSDRIATDDFALKPLRKVDGECGLAGGRRPENYYQQRFRLRRCRGCFTGVPGTRRLCVRWGGQRAPHGIVLPNRRNASARINNTTTNNPTSFRRSRERQRASHSAGVRRVSESNLRLGCWPCSTTSFYSWS